MVKEIWKEVPGFGGKYLVSNWGNLKSIDWPFNTKHGTIGIIPGREISTHSDRLGYLKVTLNNKKWLLHRVIALTFIPNKDNKPFINHINGIKSDNSLENLEWVTQKENMIHAFAAGLQVAAKGELSGKAILSNEKVLSIRKKFNEGVSRNILEKDYGVSKYCIWAIIANKTWRHI